MTQYQNTIRLNQSQAQMIAHRGCSGLELENTASAFVAAGNRSYMGIETDVHVTSDGQFIIFHDDHTKRVALDEMVIENTTFDTLRSLQLADKDGKRGRRDLIMPSLAEYAGICRKYGKVSVLELKNHMEKADIARIVDVMRACGQLEHTIFISFDLPNMIAIRELLPDQPAQFLIENKMDTPLDVFTKYHLDLDIDFHLLTKELVDDCHARGIKVNVWTVNTEEDAAFVLGCGVDYITSNILE